MRRNFAAWGLALAVALLHGAAGASTYELPGQTLTVLPTVPQQQPMLQSLVADAPGPVSNVTSPSFGTFDIVLTYDLSGINPANTALINAVTFAFASAEAYWESQVLGYRTATLGNLITSLDIDASIVTIDGAGGILGQAGATTYFNTTSYKTPASGIMEFDVADVQGLVNSGAFDEVILHEMAHVMGFSNFFWQLNGAVASSTSTQYTGASGLAAYRDEFAPGAAFVPVEESGGPGTAFSHWDEQGFANFGGSNNPELMTGFLNLPTYVSRTTVYSFEDIGYAVLPLPPAGWLLLGGLGMLTALRARRRA